MVSTVSIVGVGKLGAPMAACLAAKGLRVIGVDADLRKVQAINQDRAPVFEPGLEELIRTAHERLTATDSIDKAVSASEITFIVVATPSNCDGSFSLRYVLPACEAIGRVLRAKPDFHVVVLTSTVMPGTTGGAVRSVLEQASGKRVGHDFGLCYGPEFIALGSVIHDFLNPDFVLIGESDLRSGAILEALYKRVCENMPSVVRMSFINAEIAKLSVNTYVTAKISFANMLARICERVRDADVDVVTWALGLDSRIGAKYLRGAISYGGPCFPRDNLALAALARQVGVPADLAQATDDFNRWQVKWLADLVQQRSSDGGATGILGLAYKPNTDVIEEAFGFLLAQELVRRGVAVLGYDPACKGTAVQALDSEVRLARTAKECIERSQVVVVATPWQEFAQLPNSQWAHQSGPRTVIDCWRALTHLSNVDGVHYVGLGTGSLVECPVPRLTTRAAKA